MSAPPPDKKSRLASNGTDSTEEASAVIMVTGGKGLVGRSLEDVVNSNPNPKERWVFLSSADGDLWYEILNVLLENVSGNSSCHPPGSHTVDSHYSDRLLLGGVTSFQGKFWGLFKVA